MPIMAAPQALLARKLTPIKDGISGALPATVPVFDNHIGAGAYPSIAVEFSA